MTSEEHALDPEVPQYYPPATKRSTMVCVGIKSEPIWKAKTERESILRNEYRTRLSWCDYPTFVLLAASIIFTISIISTSADEVWTVPDWEDQPTGTRHDKIVIPGLTLRFFMIFAELALVSSVYYSAKISMRACDRGKALEHVDEEDDEETADEVKSHETRQKSERNVVGIIVAAATVLLCGIAMFVSPMYVERDSFADKNCTELAVPEGWSQPPDICTCNRGVGNEACNLRALMFAGFISSVVFTFIQTLVWERISEVDGQTGISAIELPYGYGRQIRKWREHKVREQKERKEKEIDKATITGLQNTLNALLAKVGATGVGDGEALAGAGLSPAQLFELVDTDGSGPAFVTNGTIDLEEFAAGLRNSLMEKNPSFQINANAAQEAKDSAQDAQMQALERKMHAKDAKDAEQDAKDADQEAQMQDILRKNQELEAALQARDLKDDEQGAKDAEQDAQMRELQAQVQAWRNEQGGMTKPVAEPQPEPEPEDDI